MKYRFVLLTLLLVFGSLVLFPEVSSAQGLVPCTGDRGSECQACHFVQLADNVIDWLVLVLGVIAAIMIVVAGARLAASGGDASAKEWAKRTMYNLIVGYIIVLAGWLMVDTVLKMIAGDATYGVWNDIQCVQQPQAVDFMNPTPGQSRGTASGLSEEELSQMTSEELEALAAAAGTHQEQLCAAANANGISGQCTNLQALMQIESSSCQNKVSPAGAYGCMQILPSTARQYDPSLAGLTDAQIAEKLKNDDAYNIALGTKIYTSAYNKYNGNTNLVFAAYNGGFGANDPSANCPGMLKWQCTWDGSDCINGVGSDCSVNTGYQETRNYVNNINALSSQLSN